MATRQPPGSATRSGTRFYARISLIMDTQGSVQHRRTLLTGLAGRAPEVDAGLEITSLRRFRFPRARWPTGRTSRPGDRPPSNQPQVGDRLRAALG
jgi:hypothetical protein